MRLSPLFTVFTLSLLLSAPAMADDGKGFLEHIKQHKTLASTAIQNGDLNPYGVFVAPVSAGTIQKDDVLISNFNDISNLQGTGSTIVKYSPSTQQIDLFAKVPKDLKGCTGGVGLTTALTMLKSGWVIVGSTPSKDGTTKTRGAGCLIVLDPNGKVASVLTGPKINGPWGNIANIDKGDSATLFISMAGYDVPGPDQIDPATNYPTIIRKAKVVRFDLSIPAGKPPVVNSQTIIADGLGSQATRSAFMTGPTGLAMAVDGKTLYASDGVNNRIIAIENAVARTDSAGEGREVTHDGLLKRPLAMIMEPGGHLLANNALNGQIVEIDPLTGKQIYAQWIDADQAQSPPGNGDLFGLALTPDGKGFYYVEDDVNTLVEAKE